MNDKGDKLLKALSDSIHNLRNPLFRVKRRFSRYVLITCFTGTLSFIIAWVMLHVGFMPLISLVVSALGSGLLSYGAMELWAFPNRDGKLSWSRLYGNALVGIGGFAARYGVLLLALGHFSFLRPPLDNAVPLILAYLASFCFGYMIRTRIIFKH